MLPCFNKEKERKGKERKGKERKGKGCGKERKGMGSPKLAALKRGGQIVHEACAGFLATDEHPHLKTKKIKRVH
jgi:hypothetical protein